MQTGGRSGSLRGSGVASRDRELRHVAMLWPLGDFDFGGGGKDFGRVGRGCFLPEARQPHTAIPSEAAAADRAEDGPNEAEEANGFLGLPGFLVMFGFGCCDGCDAICRK